MVSTISRPRLFISGVKKSSGKTLLTLGLASALGAVGRTVQLFKKGPDYIDPMWHREASGRVSYNLDEYLMTRGDILESFIAHGAGSDLSLVEGNLGLHDGMDLEGRYSSADLAKLLRAPVLLVVDATGMNRNAAAVVYGMGNFDPEVKVSGVVLNRVKSARQEAKQVQAIEHYCGLPVVGALPALEEGMIPERHLGLVTPWENPAVAEVVGAMGGLVAEHVNLEQVQSLAQGAAPLQLPEEGDAHPASAGGKKDVRIGIAQDPAFCFYYRDNLEALEAAGAELVPFDCLRDPALPEVDGIYIAGGFPESFLDELEANRALRLDIAGRIESGLPAYAECGGMMYLTRSITLDDTTREMVGVIPADTRFQKKPVGYGYVELSPTPRTGWLNLRRDIRGHEFHYSRLVNVDPALIYAYEVKRGAGMGQSRDGIVLRNLLASYCHLHTRSIPEWSESFVAAARAHRAGTTTP